MTALAVVIVGAATVTGCGSSSSSGTGTGGSSAPKTTGTTSAPDIAYDGPEAGIPFTISATKPGKPFTVGWQVISPNGPTLGEANAAKAQVEKLGGKFIMLQDNADPSTQVKNCTTLVVQKVSAIVLYPFVPGSLKACFQRAQQQGIQIVAQQNPPFVSPGPLPAPLKTDALQGFDTAAYLRVKAAAQADPGGTYGYIQYNAPLAAFDYALKRTQYWAGRFGLKYVGMQTAAEDPSAQAQAMTALLAKNPNVGTVFGYDDSSAQAAATIAQRQRSKVRVIGYAGSAATVDNYIKKGTMYGTICIDLKGLGVNLANAAVNQIEGKQLPKYSMTKNELLTAQNAASAAQFGCS